MGAYAGADRAEADGRFWYGLDRDILHQQGRCLLGPPAAETFAGLFPDDLRALLVAALEWWLSRTAPADTTDAVLGPCRALVKFRHGGWLSKVDAGRRVGPDLTGGPRAARDFQRQVLAEIRGAPGVPRPPVPAGPGPPRSAATSSTGRAG